VTLTQNQKQSHIRLWSKYFKAEETIHSDVVLIAYATYAR